MKVKKRITVTPTVALAAYTANDVVGGLLTFTIRAGVGLSGDILSILLTDDADQKEQYVLFLFDTLPSTIADQSAYAPTIADLKKLISTVTVATADWTTTNSNAWALLGGHEDTAMSIPFSNTSAIYMYAVATDTPDYVAATDLAIVMTVEYDEA